MILADLYKDPYTLSHHCLKSIMAMNHGKCIKNFYITKIFKSLFKCITKESPNFEKFHEKKYNTGSKITGSKYCLFSYEKYLPKHKLYHENEPILEQKKILERNIFMRIYAGISNMFPG